MEIYSILLDFFGFHKIQNKNDFYDILNILIAIITFFISKNFIKSLL